MATKNFTALKNVVPLRLVQKTISHDVVEALEVMLEAAKRGTIIGLSFACEMPRSQYITIVAGHCQTNPTFARGMVAYLASEIDDMTSQERYV